MEQELRVIDVTPTWEGIMPLLLEGVKQGIPESSEELMRLARLVDQINEAKKEEMDG
jgi:hypothetical protein